MKDTALPTQLIHTHPILNPCAPIPDCIISPGGNSSTSALETEIEFAYTRVYLFCICIVLCCICNAYNFIFQLLHSILCLPSTTRVCLKKQDICIRMRGWRQVRGLSDGSDQRKFLLKLRDYHHLKNKNPQITFFDIKIFTITAAVESLNLPDIKA